MTTILRRFSERRGSTLLTVVVVLGAMTVLSLIFLRVGQRVTDEQLTLVDAARANYLAEAGVAEAVAAIRSGGDGTIGSAEAPAYLGGGVVWVEATDLGGDRTQLDSMAMKDGGRAALRVVVENTGAAGAGGDGDGAPGSGFFTMLFSNKPIQIAQDIQIDSWDSNLGTSYAAQATNSYGGTTYAGAGGGVSSNGTIQVDAGVKIFGDAHSGPSASVSTAATAYVSGSTTPSSESFPLTQITVPTVAVSSGAYSVANNGSKTINSGTYHFTSMTQGKNSMLKVIGPATIVVDSYSTGTTAILEVDCTNGPVTFYDTGIWSVDKNYKLRPKAGTPLDAAFLISSTGTVQFDQGSLISFGFYAPNSTIQVDQGAEVWGALVADQIKTNQGTKFHFDENLANFELPWSIPDPDDVAGSDQAVQIRAWSKIEFPIAAYRSDRRSPFALLGVQHADLLSPAETWQDEADQ